MRAYGSPNARWKVQVGDQIILAAVIFDAAYDYWDKFIRSHGIANSGLGELDQTATMPKGTK
jgi:hypothetical protein